MKLAIAKAGPARPPSQPTSPFSPQKVGAAQRTSIAMWRNQTAIFWVQPANRPARHCGLCGEICHYSAIVCVGHKVLVYPELCHACGGCVLVCRPGAIAEVLRDTGTLEAGESGAVRFVLGVLNIG